MEAATLTLELGLWARTVLLPGSGCLPGTRWCAYTCTYIVCSVYIDSLFPGPIPSFSMLGMGLKIRLPFCLSTCIMILNVCACFISGGKPSRGTMWPWKRWACSVSRCSWQYEASCLHLSFSVCTRVLDNKGSIMFQHWCATKCTLKLLCCSTAIENNVASNVLVHCFSF